MNTETSVPTESGMRYLTGFDLFRAQEQEGLKLTDPPTKFKLTVQMPLIAAKWKNLDEASRMDFKARGKAYGMVPSKSRKKRKRDGDEEIPKKKRKTRDPALPKRPMSAFIFFSCERRKTLRIEQPDLKPTDCLKQMGMEWKQLLDRQPFLLMAELDKTRYATEACLMPAKAV